jgi:hypothetical protein
MAALQYHLANKALSWLQANGATLTPDAELELHSLLDLAETRASARVNFALGNVPQGSVDLAEVEANLEKLLDRAKAEAGGGPIDHIALQNARLSLCPLFPFC